MDIMDVLGPVIFVGLIGLLAVFILLKICSTRPILNTVFILAACVSLIVTSFAMPIKNKGGVAEYDWYWVLGQAVCMFLMFVLFSAEMAFDTETVEVATARETWGGGVEVTSRLEERSMFWGVLGGSLGATAVLVTLNYMIFDSAIGLGIFGSCVTAFIVFVEIKHWLGRFQRSLY